ncbi:hypothetical protein GCM10009673_17970 [Nesterenkonia sandarakina]
MPPETPGTVSTVPIIAPRIRFPGSEVRRAESADSPAAMGFASGGVEDWEDSTVMMYSSMKCETKNDKAPASGARNWVGRF